MSQPTIGATIAMVVIGYSGPAAALLDLSVVLLSAGLLSGGLSIVGLAIQMVTISR
jgi:hypothetical protein